MPREFQGQAELHDYAERNCLEYAWEYTPAFAKRQRLLSPEQYEIVEVRTSRGVSWVMLFSKAIIRAEWEANAPLREGHQATRSNTAGAMSLNGTAIRCSWSVLSTRSTRRPLYVADQIQFELT